MRIKKQFLAIIIASILIVSSVIGFLAYQSVQEGRVAYIGIEVDKQYYSSEENVTFRLVSINDGVDFNITDHWTDWNMEQMDGLDVIKLPETTDPDTFFDDEDPLSYISLQSNYYVGKVHYEYFNSEDGPLHLTWDGTIRWSGNVNGTYSTIHVPATSGYYVISPKISYYTSEENHVFVIDESAIFYYDAMNANVSATNDVGDNVTYELTLQAPSGTVGNVTCDLFTTFQYDGDPFDGTDDMRSSFNQTGIVITAGQATYITIIFNASIPDHGYLYNYDEDYNETYFSPVIFDAWLVTSIGNYTFGLWAKWDGGWFDEQQY